MRALRFPFSKTLSSCCKHKSLIVQSREGGFVSQNCLKCSRPSYIRDVELPDLVCDFCGDPLTVGRVDGQNYFYVCVRCARSWKVGDTVPHWSELFGYSGLAAGGDGPSVIIL